MIIYVCKINHRKTYGRHVYNDDYPLWEKHDNICEADIETIHGRTYLKLWRKVSGTTKYTAAILSPYDQDTHERVNSVWFNHNIYYLNSVSDLYRCTEQLTMDLHNEEVERILETV